MIHDHMTLLYPYVPVYQGTNQEGIPVVNSLLKCKDIYGNTSFPCIPSQAFGTTPASICCTPHSEFTGTLCVYRYRSGPCWMLTSLSQEESSVSGTKWKLFSVMFITSCAYRSYYEDSSLLCAKEVCCYN